MITSNTFQDELLQELRASVQQFSDDVPVMLLPLRVETRFMTLHRARPLHAYNTLQQIMEDVAALAVKLYGQRLPADAQWYRDARTAADALAVTVEQLGSLTGRHRDLLGRLTKELVGAASKLKGSNPQILKTDVVDACNRLLDKVQKAAVVTSAETDHARNLLDDFQRIEKRLRNIAEERLPYKNPRNKKDLYSFVETVLADTLRHYEVTVDGVARVGKIEQGQYGRLETLNSAIRNHALQMPVALRSVHSNSEPWLNFLQKIQTTINTRLIPAINRFVAQHLPVLGTLAQIGAVDWAELAYRSAQTWIYSAQPSFSESKSYKNIKKTRKKIAASQKSLLKMSAKAIYGTSDQLAATGALLQRSYGGFTFLSQSLGNIAVKKNNHKIGINATGKYLSTLSQQTDFGNIFHEAVSQTNALTLHSAAMFAEKALSDIQNLLEKISRNQISEAETSTILDPLADSFETAQNENYVLSEVQLQPLDTSIANLEQRLGLNIVYRVKIGRIRSAFESLNAVITNPKSPYYKKYRNRLVATTPGEISDELWVRIYPDNLFVNTHEPELTEQETRLGQQYWLNRWIASSDPDLEMSAWKGLVAALGSHRAAWVAQSLDPRELNADWALTRPSLRAQEVIATLQTTQDRLRTIRTDAPLSEFLSQVQSVAVAYLMVQAMQALSGRATEQVYLLEKIDNWLQRIHQSLRIIEQRLQQTGPAERQNALFASAAQIAHNNALAFNELINRRKVIQSLSIEIFAASHSVERFVFPLTDTKSGDYTRVPVSPVIPNRFAVVTKSGGKYEHIVVGRAVPRDLALGLAPNLNPNTPSQWASTPGGDLEPEQGIRWMTDFEEAKAKGMGVVIPLTREQRNRGIDQLFVLGLQESDFDASTAAVKMMFDGHHFSPFGMAFLTPETPTNHSEGETSGWVRTDKESELAYKVEMGEPLFPDILPSDFYEKTDGARLSTALGLPTQTFQHIHQAGETSISDATAMHRSLWHGTLGVYLTEMWNTLLTTDNIRRTQAFFREHVVGRGSLPSLRIGRQPYGFLVTTAFSQLKFDELFDAQNLPPHQENEAVLQKRFDIRLHHFLMKAHELFASLRLQHVRHAGNVDAANPQQHFMEMLGLNPVSVEHFVRFGANLGNRGRSDTLSDIYNTSYGEGELASVFGDLVRNGFFGRDFVLPEGRGLIDGYNPFLLFQYRRFIDSQVFRQRFLDGQYEVVRALVAPAAKKTDQLPRLGSEEDNFITWLLRSMEETRDIYRLLQGTGDKEEPRFPSDSLLFLLLKQSLWEALTEASLDVLEQDGFFSGLYRRRLSNPVYQTQINQFSRKFYATDRYAWLLKDLEDMNGINGLNFGTQPLYQHLSAGSRAKSMANYLLNQENMMSNYPDGRVHEHAIYYWRDNLDAMRHLQTKTVGKLERLLREHLDLCAYRLDAWVLGLANKRLQDIRNIQASGLYVGGYGWLENIRPGRSRAHATDISADLAGTSGTPIFQDNENQGFIHAPSTAQAITAAILRAGYRANQQAGNLSNRFSVNLSSARIRMAFNLLDGIRNGNELGALLGYQLERGLHERYQTAEMDQYIYPLRARFPLVVPVAENTGDESDAANTQANVTNGLSILEAVYKHLKDAGFDRIDRLYDVLHADTANRVPPDLRSIIGGNPQAMDVLLKEIDRMADALDAVGDLAVSESVYQLVHGNHVRAAAVVSALAEGRTLPDIQVADTPRTGVVINHRVLLHLPVQSTPPPFWPKELTPRAEATISLNYWLGLQMGDPARICCLARFGKGDSATTETVRLSDLGLQPTDCLYLVQFEGEKAFSELESRIFDYLQRKTARNINDTINLSFVERSSLWEPNILTFYQFEPFVCALRDMLAQAQPLSNADLLQARDKYDPGNPGNQQIASVRQAAERARQRLALLADEIKMWMDAHKVWGTAPPPDDTPDTVASLELAVAISIKAAALNLNNAYPGPEMRQSAKSMYLHISGLSKSATRLMEAVDTLLKEGARQEAPLKARVDQYTETLKTIYGKAFPVIPTYRPLGWAAFLEQDQLPAHKSLLRHSLAQSAGLEEWLEDISPVRPVMQALENFLLLSHILRHTAESMRIFQFPYRDGDYWAGVEYPGNWTPSEDKSSIVGINMEDFLMAMGGDCCGLVLDEWAEVIPSKQETTAIGFHYDQPNAEPAQTVLLAVTPRRTGQWSWDDLIQTLEETLELAKTRAVEPDHIEKSMLQHILPAIAAENMPKTPKFKLFLPEHISFSNFENILKKDAD